MVQYPSRETNTITQANNNMNIKIKREIYTQKHRNLEQLQAVDKMNKMIFIYGNDVTR